MNPNPRFKFFFLFLTTTLGACAGGAMHASTEPSERARLLLEVANGRLMDGDAIGALQNLELAEKADASVVEIYQTRALAFSVRNDLPRAIAAAEEANRRAPARPEFQHTLGKFLMDAGQNARAEPLLRKAADNPLYREAYKAKTLLGLMRLKRGDKRGAEKEFTAAIDHSPQFACGAYFQRGKMHLEGDQAVSAIRDLENSTQRFCNGMAQADLMLGDAYTQTHQVERARKKYLSIPQLYPETAEAKRALEKLRELP